MSILPYLGYFKLLTFIAKDVFLPFPGSLVTPFFLPSGSSDPTIRSEMHLFFSVPCEITYKTVLPYTSFKLTQPHCYQRAFWNFTVVRANWTFKGAFRNFTVVRANWTFKFSAAFLFSEHRRIRAVD